MRSSRQEERVFSKTRAQYVSIVFGEHARDDAMSFVFNPRAARNKTDTSRGLSFFSTARRLTNVLSPSLSSPVSQDCSVGPASNPSPRVSSLRVGASRPSWSRDERCRCGA
jgi:hypothetical protein